VDAPDGPLFPHAPPDAVVFDHSTGRPGFYLAGFYRGRGVPVVFVGREDGQTFRRFASRTGTLSLRGADEFRAWLGADPDYLRTGRPPLTRKGL
jgi:hypothetical protein